MNAPTGLHRASRSTAFVLAALLPIWTAAQTDMTLAVPYRAGTGSKQIASTTIEFNATSIAVGANIDVGGNPVNVPAPGSSNSSPDGTVVVRRIDNQRVQLDLKYKAYFGVTAGNPDWCRYTGPSTPRTYVISLTGFTFTGGGTGYRITSFMGPPDVSCSTAYLRVAGGDRPTLAGGLTRLGRLPLTIVLVLDKSPSMQWTIPGSTNIRWDRLKQSVQLFVSVWDTIGAPPPPGTVSSEGHADDLLGLVFFGGSATESNLDGVNFFKQRGNNTAPWGAPIAAALAPSTFIGGTSIGAGVGNGRSHLLPPIEKVPGDTSIVLFTDGEQNTPPCIIHDGETLSPTVKPYPGQPGVTYLDQCTVAASAGQTAALMLNGSVLSRDLLPMGPIYTMGLGEGGLAEAAKLLNEISDETAGRGRFPNDGLAMDTSFLDQLVDNLKGGTVSLLERVTTEVPADSKAGTPLQVLADPSLTRMTFALSWEQASANREVELELRDPNGNVVTPFLTASGPSSRVATVNLPSNGPAGTWQAIVRRFSNTSAPLKYQVSALGVESRLSSRVYESARKGTGGPIKIVAEVGWNNAALVDLPAGAIRAIIERPSENVGTIFHDSTQGDTTPPRADTSPLAMKFDHLVRGGNLLARIEPRELGKPVPLVHVGHGRYEGSFNETIVGGKYRIRVVYDWNDPRTGRIHRLESAERQVQVMPTRRDSIVQLQRDGATGNAVILVTLRDRYGNYVGPGYENNFNAQSESGKLALPFKDPEVTGTYGIRLTGLAPGDDPNVRISFGGQTIRDKRLSQIESSSGKYAVWLALGGAVPHGSFGNASDGGPLAALGAEYIFTPAYSAEATLSGHRFDGKGSASDIEVTQIGVNAKWYLSSAPMRWFVTAGVGSYAFNPGSTRFGGNVGGGLQYPIGPNLSVEGRYGLHTVTSNSPNSSFSTLQLGVRYEL